MIASATTAKPVLSYTNAEVNTRHHWVAGLPNATRFEMLMTLVRQIRHPTMPSATSRSVAYGCRSGRMPGISPRRRRGSDVAVGRRLTRSRIRPSRSIFGARLRSRVPQYGHSVIYGLTSDPQFLHTTKRSGPPVLTSSSVKASKGVAYAHCAGLRPRLDSHE